MTRDDLIAIVAAAPRKQRLRLVLQVLPTPAGVIARRAGLGRATLYRDEGRLSLSSKLRIARAVRVPASIIWPDLQTLAFELLHGFKGAK